MVVNCMVCFLTVATFIHRQKWQLLFDITGKETLCQWYTSLPIWRGLLNADLIKKKKHSLQVFFFISCQFSSASKSALGLGKWKNHQAFKLYLLDAGWFGAQPGFQSWDWLFSSCLAFLYLLPSICNMEITIVAPS